MVRDRIHGASASTTTSGGLLPSFATLSVGTSNSTLIPGLPNDLACVCLACIPLWQHGRLKAVCRSWNAALSGKFIIDLRQKLGKTEEFLCLFRDDPSLCEGEVFDPRAQLWSTFPPMPCNPYTYSLSNFECLAVGPYLFVLGGSLFDARSFPMDRPLASKSVFKYDPVKVLWDQCSDMRTPRGSFACGISEGQLFVAGGGSRHAQFGAGGDRISAVERYDVQEDRWDGLEGLQKIRAGCTGFFIEDEFWVMGGYGESRTISGILPVDEYYSDGEVLNVKTGSWRALEPMWEEGERFRLGKVAVLNGKNGEPPSVFMLERSRLLRYDIGANRWYPESELPRDVAAENSCRVVALDGEIYVIPGGPIACQRGPQREAQSTSDRTAQRHSMQWNSNENNHRRKGFIIFQVYHPVKQSWRFVVTKPPLNHSLNHPWGAMCVMKL